MKRLLRLKSTLLLAIFTLFAFSCDKNDDDNNDKDGNTSTIVETAQATDALKSLVAALTKADENEDSDLIGALSGEGPFTVFAPTNDAFTDLFGNLDDFDSLEDFDTKEKRDLLAIILKYHVVDKIAAKSTDLKDEQKIGTLQGEEVTIRLDEGIFIQDATETDAEVVSANNEASNGIVHVINKVLLPQEILDALNGEEEPGTLVDIVVATESLSVLEAAVKKAGLVETLGSEGPFTVLAPTDDAFVALLDILGEDYNELDDFDTEAEMMLLKDILLYHVIPDKTIKEADFVEGTVVTALTDNSIEVIASDDTFVIGDASAINANITGTDIMASNGVAHTIDKVLLPQSAIDFVTSLNLKTIVEIAVETDDLSLLVDALQQADAGLVELLGGEGPFTVFAPTNAAFVALLGILGDGFTSLTDFDTPEEKELLVKVLTYHVVAGTAAFSTTLMDGDEITTEQGEKVTIRKNGGVFIQDATDADAEVIGADNEASNGVVHIINKVLLPQEVLDILNPPVPNIVQLAQSVDDLSLLVDALIQADAGLVEVLNGEGPFTVFAPTNEAFADLLNTLGDDFQSLADFDTADEKALLVKVLTYHVVSGIAVASGDLESHDEIVTEQGESVEAIPGHPIKIQDKTTVKANVVGVDNIASNGIVHIIDKVLLPQEVLDILNPPSH